MAEENARLNVKQLTIPLVTVIALISLISGALITYWHGEKDRAVRAALVGAKVSDLEKRICFLEDKVSLVSSKTINNELIISGIGKEIGFINDKLADVLKIVKSLEGKINERTFSETDPNWHFSPAPSRQDS
jgi:hypothetical protein